MLANIRDRFKAWYARPYDPAMNVSGWALWLLMLLVLLIMWRIVLSHVVAGAERLGDAV